MKPWVSRLNGLMLAILTSLVLAAFAEDPATNRTMARISQGTLPHRSGESPVSLFRDLLALSPTEQAKVLAQRPPETRKRIEAKLAEYNALNPEERELRLRATELHWYLRPLMTMPAADRAQQLALVPSDIRQLVEDRLAIWDITLPPLKDELLDNELAIRYFAQPPANQTTMAKELPERHEKLDEAINRWRALPEDQHRLIESRFSEFFELTPDEKNRTLSTFSESEQQQMEKTLQAFEKMPKEQRTTCIRGFEKLSGMSNQERQQFLANAERWSRMSAEERQQWRELVTQVPQWPPLPPGAITEPANNLN